MRRSLAFLLGGAMLLAAFTTGATASVEVATGPVTNGGFELPPITRTVEVALDGSPADRCYGVGHQIMYGSETPQAEATGGPFGEPNASQADPVGAGETVVADPEGTADQQTACVWNTEDGFDIAHLHPAAATTTPAGWTVDIADPSVEFGYGHDEDVTDREAKILANGQGASRNLWQVFAPKQQAYTPNADALEISVASGSISDQAYVELGLEPTTPEAALSGEWSDCRLVFEAQQLQDALAAGAAGHLAADPANATFSARTDACQELAQQWRNADTDAERRSVLAQTRITEICFWNWNAGTTEPTVIDDVQLTGASTVAKESSSSLVVGITG